MIVTTRFPDLPPRPETPANAAFRRQYFARWGRENTVFFASTRRFESMPQASPLSVKLVERGAATLRLKRRDVLLEPGQCLIVNEGDPYSVSIASDAPVAAFSLHFRPGLAAEVHASRRLDWGQALDHGHQPPAAARDAPLLRDDLHALTPEITAAMATVRARVLEGEQDGDVFEPLLIAVIDALLTDDLRLHQQADRSLGVVRAATRAELVRRVGWARDYILSNYADPVTLDQIAAAAHLSKYHLLRTFRELIGSTPHAVLRARRAEAARALLLDGATDLAAVATAVGFGSRWAMQRALRAHCGSTARALRTTRPDRSGSA